ncbi:MAG: DUF1549 domain-containing protein, partial [Planctomycetes bacterium]|nr:DUF1549 domain-containing protein [Planctomycetota bacterium]
MPAMPSAAAADDQPAIDFERDVLPVLTKSGCNAGACHGKQRGQNGFQISLLGFDPQFDYDALTKEGRGRRVFPAHPERSLLLEKPSGRVAHGGGIRLKPDSDGYRILYRWIASGARRAIPGTPELVAVNVEPSERVLSPGEALQLSVTARYSDGSTRDITRLADYQSNESAIAAVDPQGKIAAGPIVGEAAIMARYMGSIAVCTVAVPLAGEVPAVVFAKMPRQNFIDEHVWAKLQRLGITPSEPAPDHKFLRRAYIDIIGRVPTV